MTILAALKPSAARCIVASPEVTTIPSRPSLQDVRPGSTAQRVRPRPSSHEIRIRSTSHDVMPSHPADHVVSRTADEHVRPRPASNGVATRAGGNEVIRPSTRDVVVSISSGYLRWSPRINHHRVVACSRNDVDHTNGLTRTLHGDRDGVVTAPGVDDHPPRDARVYEGCGDRVVTGTPLDRLESVVHVAGPNHQQVVAGGATRRTRHGIGGRGWSDGRDRGGGR